MSINPFVEIRVSSAHSLGLVKIVSFFASSSGVWTSWLFLQRILPSQAVSWQVRAESRRLRPNLFIVGPSHNKETTARLEARTIRIKKNLTSKKPGTAGVGGKVLRLLIVHYDQIVQ